MFELLCPAVIWVRTARFVQGLPHFSLSHHVSTDGSYSAGVSSVPGVRYPWRQDMSQPPEQRRFVDRQPHEHRRLSEGFEFYYSSSQQVTELRISFVTDQGLHGGRRGRSRSCSTTPGPDAAGAGPPILTAAVALGPHCPGGRAQCYPVRVTIGRQRGPPQHRHLDVSRRRVSRRPSHQRQREYWRG